jgi:signal peptidase I
MPARLTCRARPETRPAMAELPTDTSPATIRRPIGPRVRFYVLLAFAAWLVRSLVVAPFSIPSGSMLPTMAVGDYLFVAKWPYGYSRFSFPFQIPSFDGRVFASLPRRGDIVVFKRPGQEVDWVKRVVGLPGDTVSVDSGRLIINGRPVARSGEGMLGVPVSPNSPCQVAAGATAETVDVGGEILCRYPLFREHLPDGRSWLVIDQIDNPRGDHFGPVKVPAGHVFLMGDNRDDSLDSRYTPSEGGLGPVPVDHLVGKATFAFWSTDGSASYWLPWTWFSALRPERIGKDYRP